MVGVIWFFKMSKIGNIVKKLKNHCYSLLLLGDMGDWDQKQALTGSPLALRLTQTKQKLVVNQFLEINKRGVSNEHGGKCIFVFIRFIQRPFHKN